MKVTIEFCPIENKFELEAAIKTADMYNTLKNILVFLKKDISFYEEKGDFTEGENALKSLQHKILGEIADNGLDNLIFNY